MQRCETSFRAALVVMVGFAMGCSDSKEDASDTVACVKDHVCQAKCASDPDCAKSGGAGGGAGAHASSSSISSGGGGKTGGEEGGTSNRGSSAKEQGVSDVFASCKSDTRFIDNGDETISDCKQKLLWEKASRSSIDEAVSKLDSDGNLLTGTFAYCRTRSLGKKSGWRLPSIDELVSIYSGEGGGVTGEKTENGCYLPTPFSGNCESGSFGTISSTLCSVATLEACGMNLTKPCNVGSHYGYFMAVDFSKSGSIPCQVDPAHVVPASGRVVGPAYVVNVRCVWDGKTDPVGVEKCDEGNSTGGASGSGGASSGGEDGCNSCLSACSGLSGCCTGCGCMCEDACGGCF